MARRFDSGLRGLFPDDAVGPAPVPDELRQIAAELPPSLRLGTSSWSFPGWAGLVYDRPASPRVLAREGLAAYARHPLLRAAGIDRTYYAPIGAKVLAEYAVQVPGDFRFLVKVPAQVVDPVTRDAHGRALERNLSFLDSGWAAEFSVAPFVEGLADRAGVLLVQFPPLGREITREPARFAGRLARFLEALPRGVPYAVELRDREILGPDYAEALAAGGATHCLSVHPRVPRPAEQRGYLALGPGRLIVARWMLHSGHAYEEAREAYAPFDRLVEEDPESRQSLADLLASAVRAGQTAILIANNKAEGSAPLTCFRLAGAVAALLREGRGGFSGGPRTGA